MVLVFHMKTVLYHVWTESSITNILVVLFFIYISILVNLCILLCYILWYVMLCYVMLVQQSLTNHNMSITDRSICGFLFVSSCIIWFYVWRAFNWVHTKKLMAPAQRDLYFCFVNHGVYQEHNPHSRELLHVPNYS